MSWTPETAITTESNVSPQFNPNALIAPNKIDPGAWQCKWLDANEALKTNYEVAGGATADTQLRAGDHATPLVWTEGRAVCATDDDYIKWRVNTEGIDPTQPMYVSAVFKHTAAAADTGIDITLVYSASAYAGAFWDNIPTHAAEPSLSSSVTLAAHTASATANTIEWTAIETLPAGTFPDAPFWLLQMKLDDSGDAEATEIYLQGLAIWYKPRLMRSELL